MTRINFYHLQKQSLENVLAVLLQKSYSLDKKIVLKVGNADNLEKLNAYLWSFRDDSFLPHGSKKDGFAAEQPIWLTTENDNPNNAAFLFLVDGAEAETDELSGYERVFAIFDGNSDSALAQARQLWKNYKSSGFEVLYWQQNDLGAWEQKA